MVKLGGKWFGTVVLGKARLCSAGCPLVRLGFGTARLVADRLGMARLHREWRCWVRCRLGVRARYHAVLVP